MGLSVVRLGVQREGGRSDEGLGVQSVIAAAGKKDEHNEEGAEHAPGKGKERGRHQHRHHRLQQGGGAEDDLLLLGDAKNARGGRALRDRAKGLDADGGGGGDGGGAGALLRCCANLLRRGVRDRRAVPWRDVLLRREDLGVGTRADAAV